jgi:PTS system nitrogen regulatory IIA component
MKLTLRQVAQALDSPLETIERWVRQGRIPIQRSGSDYTFETIVLEKWAAQHHLPFSLPLQDNLEKADFISETLLAAMQRGGTFYDLPGDEMHAILGAAVALIPGLTPSIQAELFSRLIEREKLASTGIGKGVAIPHPRTPLSQPLQESSITTCFLKNPVDFKAVDDVPVFILFVLLSPSVKIHLHLLSRLAFCVRDNHFIEFLRQRPEPRPLYSRITDFEKMLDREY